MALQVTFTADRGKVTRRNKDGSHAEGDGDDHHILIGPGNQSAGAQDHYRSLVHFPLSWAGMKNVVKVEIALTSETGATSHFSVGSAPAMWVHILTQVFTSGNNGENVWDPTEYANPSKSGTAKFTIPLDMTKTPPIVPDATRMYFDVTTLIQPYAPTGVIFPNGNGGGGLMSKNFGFMLRSPDPETATSQRMIFFSDKGSPKPSLIITYDPVNSQPTAPTILGPALTNVSMGDSFTGSHNDPEGDPMKARVIQIRKQGTTTPVWTLDAGLQSAGSDESQTGVFSVPLSAATAFLKLGTVFEWRAATQDSQGAPSTWLKTTGADQATFSAWRALTVTSSAPTITASNLTTIAKMDQATFGGVYSDPESNRLASFDLQMQAVSAHTDAAFANPLLFVWATGEQQATAGEVLATPPTIKRPYGGKALQPGNYTYRIRARDSTGAWSAWSYDDFALTEVFNPDPNPDDPTDPNDLRLTTQIARNAPTRIALLGMGTNRGPGALIGYIDDPQDLGASAFLNSGGELYFSLPATHPYCPVIEPHQVHYRVEQYYGDRYVPKFAGLITDFDADAETVTFYGTDYLGLLQTSVDDRFNPSNDRLVADGNGGGGSYYSDKPVSWIITDQLRHHKAVPSSEVGFITVGTITALAERATIHSTYAECLPFVGGLIDTHQQGTGRVARLYAKPSADYLSWAWTLTDNWGKDRPSIRLEWGGLVNDFKVVALGDFGTRILAVGQKRGEVAVYRAVGVGGMDETKWGRRTQTRFYPDIIDQADLQRRANEDAAALAKVGKRIALALPSGMLGPFDGYDLGDNIVVDIERGVVNTMLYGSNGLWNIIGLEWRYYGDGHSDITFTVVPKPGSKGANPDLIPSSNPGVPLDWQVGYGVPGKYANPPNPTPPPASTFAARNTADGVTTFDTLPLSTDPTVGAHYQDLNTGCIYALDQELYSPPGDPAQNPNPNFETYVLVSCPSPGGSSTTVGPTPPASPNVGDIWIDDSVTPSISYIWDGSTWIAQVGVPGPPGPPGPVGGADTIPPPTPVIKSTSSATATQDDGTALTNLSAVVGYTPPPSGLNDLDQIVMQSTRFGLASDPTLPDWTLATQWITQAADKIGTADTNVIQPSVYSATPYWLRVAAADTSGNRSGWSATTKVTTSTDAIGPPQPTSVTLTPGMGVFAVRWAAIEVEDLAYVEVEWAPHGTTTWTSIQVGGTQVVVAGVLNETAYDVRVRSVDTSGNTQNADGTSIASDVDPEAGWVVAGTVTPTTLHGSDLVWGSAEIGKVFAGQINADWITAGSLHVGGATGNAAAIVVYDATGHLIGRWSTAGIEVWDPANSDYKMVLTAAGLNIYTGMSAVPPAPYPVVSMGPLGIDAASVTFGSQRGGHNLIQNSSFELGAYGVSAITNQTWDLAADWNAGRQGADINITTGATSLSVTVI